MLPVYLQYWNFLFSVKLWEILLELFQNEAALKLVQFIRYVDLEFYLVSNSYVNCLVIIVNSF